MQTKLILLSIVFYSLFTNVYTKKRKDWFRRKQSHQSNEKIQPTTPFSTTTDWVTPTGISDTTTEAFIITTAEEAEGEHKIEECALGESAYSESDLKLIINYKELDMNIQKSLNDSNFHNTSIILESFKEKFKVFENRFENSPRHLIHILDEMAQMQAKLEPLVNKTVLLLKQFPSLEEDFNASLNETKKYISNLGKLKILCESNCEFTRFQNSILSYRQQITKDEKFYCSTFNEINKTIMERMTKFQPTFIAELNQIREENLKNIEEKITQFSAKLKETAVERFGITMHDILDLQDNYVHFSNYIKDSKVSDDLQLIKQNNFHINSKLVDLEKMVNKYRDYCLHCHENHVINRAAFEMNSIPDADNLNDKPITEPPQNFLEKLLHEKILEIEDVIKAQDEENFKSIFKVLDDEKTIENYLAKLQPLKEELAFKVQREIKVLDLLQNEVPKSSIDNVSRLLGKTKETLNMIDDALEFIYSIIK